MPNKDISIKGHKSNRRTVLTTTNYDHWTTRNNNREYAAFVNDEFSQLEDN